MMGRIFPVLLGLIALVVSIGQGRKKNMWPWVVVYWCVLTMKNVVDMLI